MTLVWGERDRWGSQVKLYSIAHAVVLQCQLVLEGTLPLAFEKDLVGLTADASGYLGLKKF